MKAQGRWEQAVMRSGWGAYEHHLRRCTDIEKRRPCERQKIEALQPRGDLQEDGKVLLYEIVGKQEWAQKLD